jgi:hypothetical protein
VQFELVIAVSALPDGSALIVCALNDQRGIDNFGVFNVTASGALDTRFGANAVIKAPMFDGRTHAGGL